MRKGYSQPADNRHFNSNWPVSTRPRMPGHAITMVLLCLFLGSTARTAHGLTLYNGTNVSNFPAGMFDESLAIVYFDEIAQPQSGDFWTDSVFCNLTVDSVADRLRPKYASYTGVMMLDVEPNTDLATDGSYLKPCLATYLLTAEDNFAAVPLYRIILEGARKAAPKARIGFYGIPLRSTHVAFTEAGYQFRWTVTQTQDDYISTEVELHERLTRFTDVVFPVAYWNGKWPDIYARIWELQAMAGEFAHWDKDVIFLVNPYRSNKCGFLDAASIRFQLNTLRSFGIDGIVYWLFDFEGSDSKVPEWKQQNCHWPTNDMSQSSQAKWLQDSMKNGLSHNDYPDSQWMLELQHFKSSD